MAITGTPLRIQLLGPVRAWRDGTEVPLGPPKQRAVLSLLASRANDVVGVDTIVDALWDGDVPHSAANSVHTYVAGLRRELEPGRSRRGASAVLVSASGGYCLRTEPDQVDAALFVRRHTEARRSWAQGDTDTSLRLYEEALSLWRGEAYAAIPGPFASMERTRLRDLRLTAVEEWAADMLAAGRHGETAAELIRAVSEEPLREKLRWLLMLTLYRNGRQAHALRVYDEIRRLLSSELGIEPGAELRDLYQQILCGHPGLRTHGGDTTAALPEAPREILLSQAPSPRQLPPSVRGFVGRAVELARLADVLEDELTRSDATTPVAVVDGPAGAGKSAFVLRLAHRLLDRFPDGQLYVDLCGTAVRGKPLTAQEALAQLLDGLGVDATRMPAGLAARASLYRSLLHGRRMLVVLDDALSADQLRPLIPGGSCCVLATSRQRLAGLAARDGAHLLTVGPLDDSTSARLLTGLSGSRLVGQEAAVRRLVAVCGGLPLALRIVAHGLAASPGVPLSTLVEQYAAEHSRLDRLTVEGDANASMRCAFAASYRALPADAARMFRYLGLHGGPFTVEIAATLAETDRDTTRRLLSLLAAHHLLEEEPGHRYRFHGLIGLYAAECAERESPALRQAALTRVLERGPAAPRARCLNGGAGRPDVRTVSL
ncbi:BTAD domain-containing putative transcriptional regulator [Streptomyces glaucescens]|uniref:Putative AfsR family transcriptional regulator n=1 Tax=Streptomyces glaucescens TaxID=1907 RepID=A0A089X1M2_STRGA|nr:BTAD domain-containing putative transcriptional regulator [Streptomyces glaucescens]AIR96908.1 putative AfsR family transcriptional regulator [Streptomyces glaucescens]